MLPDVRDRRKLTAPPALLMGSSDGSTPSGRIHPRIGPDARVAVSYQQPMVEAGISRSSEEFIQLLS